ncbi:metal ABC transporter permease [Vallitaleaceae bacterium 9-2]
MWNAIMNYSFMQNALIAALLASIVCGIIGTIIIEKQLVSMSGGIAHTSFGGIGLGYLLGIEPIIGGFAFAIMAAIAIVTIRRRANTYTDTLIGMFWSVGMALGILFITLTPGYPPDMTSYLFGDILTVSSTYLYLIMILALVIIFVIIGKFKIVKGYLFDEEYLVVLGLNVRLYEYVLFIMIAMAVVIMIKVVGIILVIALLTIPPAIAKLFSNRLEKIMLLSIFVGTLVSVMGLIFSYYFDIPSGATIIIVSVTCYIIAYMLKGIKPKPNSH